MRYQSTLGLDDVEIEELVRRIGQVLGDRPSSSGRPRLLGLYRQVVLVLLYVRQHLSQMVLADVFGVSQPTVSRIYRFIMPLLDQVLCVHEPDLPAVFRNREVVVDGTVVPMQNRANNRENYSGVRRQQGLKVQVAAATDGTLLAVSDPAPGPRHDRRAITECGWNQSWITTPGWRIRPTWAPPRLFPRNDPNITSSPARSGPSTDQYRYAGALSNAPSLISSNGRS